VAVLLDANVLIALLVADHVHHDAAETWLGHDDFSFATCPNTEGGLVRLIVREGQSGAVAASLLAAMADHPRHVFWPDDLPYHQADLASVIGHRQVTDAYLASLARPVAERGSRGDETAMHLVDRLAHGPAQVLHVGHHQPLGLRMDPPAEAPFANRARQEAFERGPGEGSSTPPAGFPCSTRSTRRRRGARTPISAPPCCSSSPAGLGRPSS
jgi:uncharacterized protein